MSVTAPLLLPLSTSFCAEALIEVDGLKKATHRQKGKSVSVGVLAREANRWIQESLESGDGVIGETKREKVNVPGDDAILAYCLYPSGPRVRTDLKVA